MKRKFTTLISVFLSNFLLAETTKLSPEEITTKRVADNVLQHTSFEIVNKRTGEKWASTQGLAYSPDVQMESPYNEWEYWYGVLNIGMMQLGSAVNDKKYIDYSLHNFDFIFSNLSYFREQFEKEYDNASLFAFYRLSELDDCCAMGAALADVNQLTNKKEYSQYLTNAANYISNKQMRVN